MLLRDLQLPDTLKQAIEAKQQAQQEAQRMEFVLQRERQEAERKRVEAQGIKDFQHIVTEGISEKLLEWKGIEATVELARSPNSKVVVVERARRGCRSSSRPTSRRSPDQNPNFTPNSQDLLDDWTLGFGSYRKYFATNSKKAFQSSGVAACPPVW